jgi:ribosomal protein L7/L12
MIQLTDQQRQAINAEIFGGRKIEAIKLYREATGCQLIDAKQAVEGIEKDLRERQPESFAHETAKSGCLGIMACCALLVGGVVMATIYILHS